MAKEMKNRTVRDLACRLGLALTLALAAQPTVVRSTEAASYTVDTVVDENDGSCSDGDCSLRDAIILANNNPGPDTVNFNITAGCSGGVCTIQPNSALPALSGGGTTIDGYTQPGALQATATASAALKIEVDGSNAGDGIDGFTITSSENVIQGLVINRFKGIGYVNGSGIVITGTGATTNTVSGNYIGTNVSGTAALSNTVDGIFITAGAQNNVIGGDSPAERNVISGNRWRGIHLRCDGGSTAGNIISANYIGTDADGTAAVGGTKYGVMITNGASYNIVGGDTSGERNVISGNVVGVRICASSTRGNTVSGNYIGTDATGTAALGNAWYGVQFANYLRNNTVGPGNVIAHNGRGVQVHGGSNTIGNIITQNSIFSNDYEGIDLVSGAHGDIAAPIIVTTTVGSLNIVGTACPGCTVEVFENGNTDGEGETYVGSATATASGAFTVTVGSLDKPFLTATAMDAISGTSEFSAVFSTWPQVYLPLILRNH